MNSFSLPKDSPIALEEMQERLNQWESAGSLLLFKRHFGKDATLKINTPNGFRVLATLADVQKELHPDLPQEYLEWDKLLASAEVNSIWASRNEERRRNARKANSSSAGSVVSARNGMSKVRVGMVGVRNRAI